MTNISNPSISKIIAKYNISARSQNILNSANIENLQELYDYFDKYGTFSRIRNCGEKSNRELTKLISKLKQEENGNIYESENLISFGFESGDKTILSRKGIHNSSDLQTIPIEDYNKLPRLLKSKIKIFLQTQDYFKILVEKNKQIKREYNDSQVKNILRSLEQFTVDNNSDFIYNNFAFHDTFHLCIQIISTYTEKVLSNLVIYESSNVDKQVVSINRIHLKKLLNSIDVNLISISDFHEEIAAYYDNCDDIKKEIIQLFINTQKHAIIEIGQTCHVIPFCEMNQYRTILNSIKNFSVIKPEQIQISATIEADKKFLHLLNLHFNITINDNIISNNPPTSIQNQIYYYLKDCPTPISFQNIVDKFGINEGRIASIRSLLARDPRILYYGKIGILGLVENTTEIDKILSQTIANATHDIIKIYKLQCCSFETVKVLYESINKEITQNSWRSNIQLSTNDVLIKKSSAFTRVNYLNTQYIRTRLDEIRNDLTTLISGQYKGSVDTLSINIIIFNNSNLPTDLHDTTTTIKQVIIKNRERIESVIIEKSIKFNPTLFRNAFGFNLKHQRRTEHTLNQITQDGLITYPENQTLINAYNESDFNKRIIKSFLEDFILQKKINIDEQILHIFEYNNWQKCTINELRNEMLGLYFGVELPLHMLLACRIIKIDGEILYFDNSNYQKFENDLVIMGTKLRIEVIQSLFENVHFEYDLNIGQDRIFVRYKENSNLENLIYFAVISILIEQNNHSLNSILKSRQQISESIKKLLDIQL